jgi:hypothetical protein
MIKVNLADGKTVSFDLHCPEQVRQWQEKSSNLDFQREIRGMAIIHNHHWYALPLPKNFRIIQMHAELIENRKQNVKEEHKFVGERIRCYADDIMIALLVYYSNRPKMSRVDIIKTGKRRFNPDIK